MALAFPGELETHSSLANQLVRMRHAIDLQELAFSRLAAEFAATDYYEEDGAATPIDWIRFHCNMTSNAAADRVAVGKRLESLTSTVAATVAGEIGFPHVVVMARTADAVGDSFNEQELHDKAVTSTPGKFRFVCQHYRHAADPDAYASEQETLAKNRRLSLSTWEDGSLLNNGVVDPEGGAVLRSALEPLARPRGEHDDRNRDRRLGTRWWSSRAAASAGEPPGHQLRRDSACSGRRPGCDMEFSLPVSSKTIERMACNSRLARKALEARDRHCRWPECDRPRNGARRTTSCTGSTVVEPTSTTSSFYATGIIGWCTRAAGSWSSPKKGIVTIPPTITFGRFRGADPSPPATA